MAVRKERIPVRGLKRVSRVDQYLQFRVVRKERIPVRGLKPGIHAVQLRFHLTVRKERIPVRGLKREFVAQLSGMPAILSERNESP